MRRKLKYIHSLLPRFAYLKSCRKVNFIITPQLDVEVLARNLGYANPINAHMYKPVYTVANKNESELNCYVATLLIGKHVHNAWKQYTRIFHKDIEFNFVVDNKHNHSTELIYQSLCEELLSQINIQPNVVFARLDSVISFIRMQVLHNKFRMPKKVIEDLYVNLEQHRIRNHLLSIHQDSVYSKYLSKSEKDALYEVVPFNPVKVGSFLVAQNVTYKNKEITVINLPWGMDLAEVIARNIVDKSIKHIYCIGGVGSLSEGVEVDDLFIPTGVVDISGKSYVFENKFLTKSKVSQYGKYKKKVATGILCCVETSLSDKPNFSLNALEKGIAGFDMESAGFLKVFSEKNVPTSMIYYIMDLPHKGLGLSSTYYSKDFLRELLAKPNRGKYFCFNAVFEDIVND